MATVFISGGSRGIGKATVQEFLKNGYNVAFCYQSNEEMACEVEKLGALKIKCDVSNFEEVKKAVESVHKVFGKISVLVNNAGVCLGQKLFFDVTDEEYERTFSVNVKGMFNLAKAVVHDMLSLGGGSIVNLSSIWGVDGGSCEVLYSTQKAGVIGFTKALAKELAPSNIRVNAVAPGFIDTDMNSHLDDEAVREFCENVALNRIGKPEEVAKAILFLASSESSYITGEVLRVDGGKL